MHIESCKTEYIGQISKTPENEQYVFLITFTIAVFKSLKTFNGHNHSAF